MKKFHPGPGDAVPARKAGVPKATHKTADPMKEFGGKSGGSKGKGISPKRG